MGRCGGCRDLGAHIRWCPEVVGPTAARLGDLADQAEDVADRVGPLWPDTANWLYTFAARARAKAQLAAEQWRAGRTDG